MTLVMTSISIDTDDGSHTVPKLWQHINSYLLGQLTRQRVVNLLPVLQHNTLRLILLLYLEYYMPVLRNSKWPFSMTV
jgi:hypothetical protein